MLSKRQALRQRVWSEVLTHSTKRKTHMNHKFDELTKGLAQSTTRRGALRKFALGLAGVVLATLGLENKAHANTVRSSAIGQLECCTWNCMTEGGDYKTKTCGASCLPPFCRLGSQ